MANRNRRSDRNPGKPRSGKPRSCLGNRPWQQYQKGKFRTISTLVTWIRVVGRDVFPQKGLDKIVVSGNHLGFSQAERADGLFPVRSLKRAEYSECQEASASIASPKGSQPIGKIDHQNSDQEVAGQCSGQGIRCSTRSIDIPIEAFGSDGIQGHHPSEQSFADQESA